MGRMEAATMTAPTWFHRLAGSRPACGATGRVRAVRFRAALTPLLGADVLPLGPRLFRGAYSGSVTLSPHTLPPTTGWATLSKPRLFYRIPTQEHGSP